ncbi:PAS domain S-box protein [Bacillus sp. V3B]|uniref:sensor histidine kinase n=1 Tax=Bacillus sp. V3B TaxID=2804915 RepID=UPI00210CE4D8|nr:PAS domain S-box protein [Bacillus sp. V3B]MCQ6274363.1 PAS domain S-box protein [Bacillus sp. V3B]
MDEFQKQKIPSFTVGSHDETILIDLSGTICYMSQEACKLFGYQEEETNKLNLSDLFIDINLAELDEGTIIQKYGKCKSGKTFPIFFRFSLFLFGEQPFCLLMLQDVRNHSKLRKELVQPFNELIDLKTAIDKSTIFAFTDHKGIIKYVNEQFCRVSKYSHEELIGQDHRIVNSGFHSKEFFKNMWRTIASGEVWKGEIKNRAKDGSTYWVDTTVVPFLNHEGKPYQYLAIRYEITKLKEAEEELQRMTKRIIDVQEDERKSLSRNLHDGIGQNLYSHLITLSRLQAEVDHPLLEQMQNEARQLIEEVREISWELRPSVLDDLGLLPAIRSFLVRYSNHNQIDVAFDCVLNRRLDSNKEISIYRMIQEALTNTCKYADTTKATVTIRELETVVRVMVEDKGKGFDPLHVTRGVGLFSMDERASAVGGTLEIISESGKGTKIILEVPIE